MINDFKHKGLERFFTEGATDGIHQDHEQQLKEMLAFMQAAVTIQDIDRPGYNLCAVEGSLPNQWAIDIDDQSRLTFVYDERFVSGVDYEVSSNDSLSV